MIAFNGKNKQTIGVALNPFFIVMHLVLTILIVFNKYSIAILCFKEFYSQC